MNKPKVVVFCGSSRFVDIMAVAAWKVEKEEKAIALGLHLLPGWYLSPSGVLPKHHLAEHEGMASEMDNLHLRKIDMADEIFVINFRDYIGDSTRNEIAYATAQGKPIRWYSSDPIGRIVDEIATAAIVRAEDMSGRCTLCGAKNENHQQDHICRMHWNNDGVCTVCGRLRKPCCRTLGKPCIGHRPGCDADCPHNHYF